MVYLLHAYFGRDGREEAEELLARHSGDPDKPRILGTFNEPIADWLSFFMFTYFTDRDGRYQLKSLAESAFDPLSRTCRFMLTEEAYHMFVGRTGITRVIKRTLEVMRALDSEDPADVRGAGAVDLPTLQRYVNFWFSSSLDLFGAEISSNAATYFATGIKGRPDEARFKDHVALGERLIIDMPDRNGGVIPEPVPMRNAMNEVDAHGLHRRLRHWDSRLEPADRRGRLRFPPGVAEPALSSLGRRVGRNPHRPRTETRSTRRSGWRITGGCGCRAQTDRAFVKSLMQRVTEPGKIAGWLAPPEIGIDNLPAAYEYVRLN